MKKLINLFFGHNLTRFRVVRWVHPVYKSIYGAFSPRYITLFGKQVELDKNDVLEYARQGENYEPETTDFFLDEIREGTTFWDIGAHIGYFSVLAQSKRANVVAWECVRDDRLILRRNIGDTVLGRFPDGMPTTNFDIAKVDVELDATEAITAVIAHANPTAILVLEWMPEFLKGDVYEITGLLAKSGFKFVGTLDKRNRVFTR